MLIIKESFSIDKQHLRRRIKKVVRCMRIPFSAQLYMAFLSLNKKLDKEKVL